MIGRPVSLDRRAEPSVWHVPDFLDFATADLLEEELGHCRQSFRNGFMLVGDRWRKTPRLVAEFGDSAFTYPDTLENEDWPTRVRGLRDLLESALSSTYNYAIANWYRDGTDHTGWHADKMQYHVEGSTIAMVSVGAPRQFAFRSEETGGLAATIALEHGSLLVMASDSQIGFEHSLRPEPAVRRRRMSLTFRHVLPTEPASCTCAP